MYVYTYDTCDTHVYTYGITKINATPQDNTAYTDEEKGRYLYIKIMVFTDKVTPQDNTAYTDEKGRDEDKPRRVYTFVPNVYLMCT